MTSIEIGFVPNLVKQNWNELFRHRLKQGIPIRTILDDIRVIRNNLTHDYGYSDIKTEHAQSHLCTISEALNHINIVQGK